MFTLGDLALTCAGAVDLKNYYFLEMCSGSEVGSYLRLTDFVHHSTIGLRVINKKKKVGGGWQLHRGDTASGARLTLKP